LTTLSPLFVGLLLDFHLIALAIFWFFIWREYQRDRFRQKMFSLRDEMFDYVAEKDLGFDFPIFQQLRTTFNGSIRFSDKLALWYVIFIWTLGRKIGFDRGAGAKYRAKLDDIFDSIEDESVRMKFQEFHQAYSMTVFGLIVSTSFFLIVLSIIAVILASLYIVLRRGITSIESELRRVRDDAVERAPHDISYAVESFSFDQGARA